MYKILAGSHRTLLLAAAACLIGSFTVYANVGLLAASAWLISAAALHPSVAELSVAIVGVRFFGLARAICRYGERYTSHDATFRLLADIRVWLYTRLEPLAPANLPGVAKGDLFSRLVADVETLQFFYLRAAFPVAIAVVVAVTTVGLLAWLAPWLAWPVAGAFLLTGCVLPIGISRLGREAGQGVVEARAKLNGSLADSLEGLTELAALGRSERQAACIAAANAELTACQERANVVASLSDALGTLGMNLTVIAVIILAGPLVAAGQLEGVYLAVVALAVQASFEAILPLPAVAYYLQESNAAFARIAAITGQQPAVNAAGIPAVPSGPLEFSVNRLSFSYSPDSPPVLSNITFSLPPGKRLAIVGASGAGKSTLAGLLLRFWDYDRGSLLLNGRDIRGYEPAAIRRAVSVVSQDTYLFNATIRDNILIAKPDAAPAELNQAVAGAMLTDFIERLPRGLDTLTGQNGLAVSGGERQRIALARALLKPAPVWLLDEPTAGLDAQAEAVVMSHILRSAGTRSLVLITHRLVGLETMDEILVLADGQIAEQGAFADLLKKKGLFYQMWALQGDLLNIS
ncbi:putative ABC transporter ATP-binding/permease protein [Sporomusa sphaeroides DSM 2875]|uniref:ABC transporter ATP-binding protein n=2 Tax=Sporomusa TaxID=2375 RepID=A0ABM9W1V6_9FIRM|nr:putative ABC transporter ATP-binding protein [Sporomusa sphaeroides DSM 2875]CVK19015.1 putative ABC transporter ATP-binding protein [Sporomusa sphaeroides DSM 2875]